MAHRYFLDAPVGQSTQVVMAGGEAQHLIRVMRAECGDEVEVFDGTGWQWMAAVRELRRNEATLEILAGEQVDREPRISLTIALAIPKGDRQKWIIEKLVELGVRKVIPLITDRGVVQPAEKARLRLQKYVISSSKQCGRNRLLEIGSAASFSDLMQHRVVHRLIAHPSSAGSGKKGMNIRDFMLQEEEVLVAIGPEGGFTAEEIQSALDQQWSMVDLGPRILRIETAAVALAAQMLLGV